MSDTTRELLQALEASLEESTRLREALEDFVTAHEYAQPLEPEVIEAHTQLAKRSQKSQQRMGMAIRHFWTTIGQERPH